MKLKLILFSSVLTIVQLQSKRLLLQTQTCGDNAQYNSCGSACPPSCDSPMTDCMAVCTEGCECQDGYTLASDEADAICILESDCPSPQCSDPKVWNDCALCPTNCENYGKSEMCTQQCQQRCECPSPYIEDENGDCIHPYYCPTTEAPETTNDECGVTEEYKECGTACPARCDTLGSMTMCTMQCVSGCFCKDGYILDGVDGECIAERECPACVQPQVVGPCADDIPRYYYNAASGECEQFSYGGCQGNDNNFATLTGCAGSCTCGDNEQYTECATPQDCAQTCDTLGEIVPCAAVCEAGCECIDGYVLDESDGVCVAERDCGSPECIDNAEYITCGSVCPDTCGEDPMACTLQCVEGCFCMDGYVLNSDCECVEEEECLSAEQGMEGPVIVQRCAGNITTSGPIRNTGGVRKIGGIMCIAFGIMMLSWM